jgi:transposase InsO family protein
VNHANADALSRIPPESELTEIQPTLIRIDRAQTSSRNYVVEEILDVRFNVESEHEEYLVKWIGYEGEDTWEPLSNLTNCSEKLSEFRKTNRYRRFIQSQAPIPTDESEEEREENDGKQDDQINSESSAAVDVALPLSLAEIATQQSLDEEIQNIRAYLANNEVPVGLEPLEPEELARFVVVATKFVLDSDTNIVYHLWEPTNGRRRLDARKQIYVPRVFRNAILKLCHDNFLSGHFGTKRTFDRVRDRFFWPTMYADTEKWCRSCVDCNSKKTPHRRPFIPTMPVEVPGRPFQFVSMDICGPFPRTSRNNQYILVLTCRFSKYAEAYALSLTEEEEVAKVLVESYIPRHGCPDHLTTDRGANFLSKMMYEVYSLFDIHKINTTAYHPQANGQTERYNSTLTTTLSMYCAYDQKDWDRFLNFATFAYNSAYHETIQEMPFFVVYGREPRLPVDMLLRRPDETYPSISTYVSDVAETLRRVYKSVKAKLKTINQEREQVNEGRKLLEFKDGDQVWLFVPQQDNDKLKLSSKLQHLWKGPCTVLERISPVNYRLDLNGIDARQQSRMHNVVHVSRLKRYVDPETQ